MKGYLIILALVFVVCPALQATKPSKDEKTLETNLKNLKGVSSAELTRAVQKI